MENKADGFSETIEASDLVRGHRARLKEKFRNSGSGSLAEYEMLELVLFRSIPRRDTKPLAKMLIQEFGSFAEVLTASPERLSDIKGMGDAVITDLQVIRASAAALLHGRVRDKNILSSWSALHDYCRAAMAFEEKEQFRVLFLDKKNRLIRDEIQQIGTVDHTPVYPREVIKRALDLSAAGIILAHNHPSGDPTPSVKDIEMTKMIDDIASSMGIIVHDHIIIAKEGHSSLKGLKLF